MFGSNRFRFQLYFQCLHCAFTQRAAPSITAPCYKQLYVQQAISKVVLKKKKHNTTELQSIFFYRKIPAPPTQSHAGMSCTKPPIFHTYPLQQSFLACHSPARLVHRSRPRPTDDPDLPFQDNVTWTKGFQNGCWFEGQFSPSH